MNQYIDRINKFATEYEFRISRGKCPVDKLFMLDRCNYSNLAEVKLPFVNDDFIADQDLIYILKVDVRVLAGIPSYTTRSWGWEPKEYEKGTIAFYHQDAEALFEYTADWLEEHADPIAPPYTHKRYGEHQITPIKCGPIGTVKHYTTTEGFEEGNLERKRNW